ncbi:hypothetical protein FRC07_006954, partial [Ceratobasidium sp. 392]
THLSQYKQTILRRLTRAAREDYVRLDEIGAVDALLNSARKLLESGTLGPSEVIPLIAALLEKMISVSRNDKRKSQATHRSRKLVTSLVATLRSAVTVSGREVVPDSVLIDVAKLAMRVIRSFADRPASPQVLEVFRLLGALPTPLVHPLLQSSLQTPSTSPSPSASPSQSKSSARHPVLVLRPLLVSRDATERWAGLACLQALHACLWAGVSLPGSEDIIPPVFDEWEVGVIMRGLGDQDKTLRQLTMRVLYGVDPQLLHAYLEQLITPPPSASNTQHQPGEALEALSFLYAKDGTGFARGVGRILDKDASKKGVDEKIVEGVVSVLHEGDHAFRSAFADALLRRVRESRDTSLVSPIAAGSPSGFKEATTTIPPVDPTTILLFATTSNDTTTGVQGTVDILLGLLDGRGSGMQEVLLLAALRLLPRLGQVAERQAANARVETFSQRSGLGRHIRRRCELFVRYAKDLDQLQKIVDRTHANSLPEFLQALLSTNPPANSQPAPKLVASPMQSPKGTTGRTSISPAFSTISLSRSPALRYDAYAPPQHAPRRARPELQSPFHRESGDSIASDGSPFLREGEDLAGEMVLQAADERRKTKGKGKMKESASHLQLDVHGTPKTITEDENLPNPNADLITLSALESPFREETAFGTLNMSNSMVAGAADPTSDSTTISSPRFHTAVMTSPRLAGSDLGSADADAIWSSFDVVEGDVTLGKQTLRGWCEQEPEHVGGRLRNMGVGFVTQNVVVEEGTKADKEQEVFAYIPSPSGSPDSEVARAVVRLKPADDGSCLWMLRCGEWELRVKIRKQLDGESG